MEQLEPQSFGRYSLERRLALGGMAEIFLARQDGPAGFTRSLVIKRILPHYADDDTFVEMFLDEAKLAAKLSHPNIVPIFEFGEEKGAFFIAMEFVRGPDLKQLLFASQKVKEGIPFAIQAKIISGCAEALNYAHNLCDDDGVPLNIVHRDVSPSNVIVSYDGIPKLLDFGIAKAASKSHKTQTGILKGKIPYMPPEQLMGRPVDGRVDVYALGVVLFELATRKLPFVGDSDFHLMKLICDSPTPKPSDVSGDVPDELERIVCKAIEKEPDARYDSARELATDLERFILADGQPVTTFDVGEFLQKLELDYGQPLGFSSAPRSNPSLARRTPSGMKAPGPAARDIPDRDVPDTSQIEGEQSDSTVIMDTSEISLDIPVDTETPVDTTETPLETMFDSEESSWAGDRTTLDTRGHGREAPLEDFVPTDTTELAPDEFEVVLEDEVTEAPKAPEAPPTAVIRSPTAAPSPAEAPAVEQAGRKLPKPLIFGLGGLAFAMLIAALIVAAMRGGETSTVTPLELAGGGVETLAPTKSSPKSDEAAPDESDDDAGSVVVPDDAASDDAVPDEASDDAAPDEVAPEPDEAAAPDKKAIKSRKGKVVLETDPWTEVYQGGKKLGVTPLTVSLNAGKYKLVFKNPAQGIEMSLVVKVKAGANISKRIKIKQGTLAVLVTPWGEVSVDGKKKGVTPISPIQLWPGKHKIEVVNPKTGKRESKTITIQPGRTQRVKFDLN